MNSIISSPDLIKTLIDIRSGRIASANEIAIASLETIKTCALNSNIEKSIDFAKELKKCCDLFIKEQPLNISLRTAIQYINHQVHSILDDKSDVSMIKHVLQNNVAICIRSIKESIDKIGEVGARLCIDDADVILTHSFSAVVLSILVNAKRLGKQFKVIVTEARPEFHGRLLSMALADFKIPVTLIIDSAHRLFMCKKHTTTQLRANKVLLGATTVTIEGDVIGKIGSSAIALSAHESKIKVYVAANTHKFYPDPVYEELSVVETDPTMVFGTNEAQKLGIEIKNPAFDIIPHEYIDLIITEMDVIPPNKAVTIVKEIYGGERGL